MRSFLASGAAVADHDAGVISLSRVFRWYGGDFVRPSRMPTLAPSAGSKVLASIRKWLPGELVDWVDATEPEVAFQDYDWGLGCSIR